MHGQEVEHITEDSQALGEAEGLLLPTSCGSWGWLSSLVLQQTPWAEYEVTHFLLAALLLHDTYIELGRFSFYQTWRRKTLEAC